MGGRQSVHPGLPHAFGCAPAPAPHAPATQNAGCMCHIFYMTFQDLSDLQIIIHASCAVALQPEMSKYLHARTLK